jgi:hypothetical protein
MPKFLNSFYFSEKPVTTNVEPPAISNHGATYASNLIICFKNKGFLAKFLKSFSGSKPSRASTDDHGLDWHQLPPAGLDLS